MHFNVHRHAFQHLRPKFRKVWLYHFMHVSQPHYALFERIPEGVHQREPSFLRQLNAVLLSLHLPCRLPSSGDELLLRHAFSVPPLKSAASLSSVPHVHSPFAMRFFAMYWP